MVIVVLCGSFSFFSLFCIFSHKIDYLEFSFLCKGPVAIKSIYSIWGFIQNGSSSHAVGGQHDLPLLLSPMAHDPAPARVGRGLSEGIRVDQLPAPLQPHLLLSWPRATRLPSVHDAWVGVNL